MDSSRPLDGLYEAEDLASVWIGTFPSEYVFEEYIKEEHSISDEDEFPKCHFWEDLGIRWHDHDFQEAVFRREIVPVESLIANISWVGSYKTELLSRCTELDISNANAFIVIYEYDYPTPAGFESPFLKFVGSFPYSTGGHPFRRQSNS